MQVMLSLAASQTAVTKENLIPAGCKIEAFSLHDKLSDKYLNAGSHAPCSVSVALKKIKEFAKQYAGVNVLFDLREKSGRLIRAKRSYTGDKYGDLSQYGNGSEKVLQEAPSGPTDKPEKKVRITSLSAANIAPRGFKIAGYEIKDVKTGNTMLSRGKGDKQDHIRDSISKFCEKREQIDFVLYLEDKAGNESQTVTRYEWDSNEAVPVQ